MDIAIAFCDDNIDLLLIIILLMQDRALLE